MHCHNDKNRLFFGLLTGGGSHRTATLQTYEDLLENDALSFHIYSNTMTNRPVGRLGAVRPINSLIPHSKSSCRDSSREDEMKPAAEV